MAGPGPGHRAVAEFCENGAKAIAEEATKGRATPEFFARHSIAELDARSEYWLGRQGRITHPMVRRPNGTHYEPIGWDEAFRLIAGELDGLDSPDEATLYTSGRASNEAAFAYQLFARAFGTNNLPDCSNMCHESTSIALQESIGIGKASVTLPDLVGADLIVIAGQNPGTNHPRMLSQLEHAKQNGARILTINPLREAGLLRFKNPQTPKGVVGRGTDLSDLHLPVRVNGDLALFQAIGALLVEWDALDHPFLERHTTGFEEWREHVSRIDWDDVTRSTGLSREQITEAAVLLRDSRKTVFCWAMGLTQHRNGVATIKEVVNLALAQGNIGKPGAGLFPVRGHSNVQGDRTMGIWERVPKTFLDSPVSSSAARATRSTRAGPVASSCRTRPGTPAPSRPRRDAASSRSRRSRCWTSPRATSCCRPCAATTSSTLPSTGCRTATAASRAAGAWSPPTARTSLPSGSTTATTSIS
ncbi:putative formate dehydrogenase oxidoreductase protein [Pseudonocardia sp. Ae168_Ps1]|nr:putative formate dehydrogenase oxidoreductase protein [Pseudonocardia sp. Ae168_Ps1]